MSLVALSIALVPTVVFLSESPPSSEEIGILRSGLKQVQDASKTHDWQVDIRGKFVWVRPIDFWSLRSFAVKLKGFEALSAIDLKSGKALVLGKVTDEQASGLRLMLSRSSHAPLFADAMKSSSFPVAVDTVRTLTLSDGTKTVEFRLPGLSATKGCEYEQPKESGKATTEPSPKSKPTMVFTFYGPASSSDRAKSAATFADSVSEALEQQNLAYERARTALLSKLSFRGPGVGGKLAADPGLYQSLSEQVQSNPGLFGFSDGNAGRSFLDSARVSATKDNVFIGCRLYGPSGTPTMTFVSADIGRFQP